MKKMLLMVLLLLLLTGCGISNPMGEQQEGDDPPEGPSVSVNDPEDETPETPEADRPEVSKPEIDRQARETRCSGRAILPRRTGGRRREALWRERNRRQPAAGDL